MRHAGKDLNGMPPQGPCAGAPDELGRWCPSWRGSQRCRTCRWTPSPPFRRPTPRQQTRRVVVHRHRCGGWALRWHLVELVRCTAAGGFQRHRGRHTEQPQRAGRTGRAFVMPAQSAFLVPPTGLRWPALRDAPTGPVRCVGAGHSFTALVPTDQWLVSLDRLSGLSEMAPGRTRCWCRAARATIRSLAPAGCGGPGAAQPAGCRCTKLRRCDQHRDPQHRRTRPAPASPMWWAAPGDGARGEVDQMQCAATPRSAGRSACRGGAWASSRKRRWVVAGPPSLTRRVWLEPAMQLLERALRSPANTATEFELPAVTRLRRGHYARHRHQRPGAHAAPPTGRAARPTPPANWLGTSPRCGWSGGLGHRF